MKNPNPNKLINFIDKTFFIKQNAVWKSVNYAKLIITAASHNTYLETVNSETMPNADTLHYRINEDTSVCQLLDNFIKLTDKQIRKLRKKKGIVIIDYTYEPFFGEISDYDIWMHKYKPVKGCRGCYKILSASILIDDERRFIYAKPVSRIADETNELEKALDYLDELGIRIGVALIDRGFARNSDNLELLNSRNVKYLGLYPKYRNIKKILKNKKRNFLNRKFKVRGIPTRLIIGRGNIDWVFVTNLEFVNFFRYLRLYKKRWNIETGFRVHDEAQIKTKSIDIRTRYFLFLVAMLLYNIWKSLDCDLSFKRFVIEIEWGVRYEYGIKST